MKNKFILLILIFVLGLTSFSTVLAKNESNQNARKPFFATNIRLAKKVPAAVQTKAKPATPPGLDKNKDKEDDSSVTGVLGDVVVNTDKYAIVIGICDYPGTGDDICSSDGDSYNMYWALRNKYGYLPENIYWLRDMGGNINGIDYGIPNKVNILSTIDEIKLVVGADAEVTFFYSGHGTYANVNDGDNELTDEGLAVHDNDGLMDEDGSATLDFIWDGELKSYFSNFATNRLVFVFDTCLAGGMNDLEDISQMVVMATSETQYAYVYSTGDFGEGVFSRYFVNEGMLQGLADNVDHDSDSTTHDVVIEEAFEYAKSNIPSYLKRRQKPVMLDNFTDDLML